MIYLNDNDFNLDEVFTGFDLEFNIGEDIIEDIDKSKEYTKKKVCVKCRVDGCVSTFHVETQEKNHYDSVHDGVKYKCTMCNNVLATKRSLSRHISSVHMKMDDANKKRYECTKCPDTFGAKQSLMYHYDECHMEKTFECMFKYCTRTFPSRRRLAYHSKTHDPGHKCLQCKCTYKAKFNLNKHMRIKHGK